MPTAYGYIRISKLRPGQMADDSLGLAAQRKAIEDFYAYKLKDEYRWGRVYEDPNQTAAKFLVCRKEGGELDRIACRGDVIVFAKLDRGFRDTLDLMQTVRGWTGRGIRFVMLDMNIDTASPIGMLMITVGVAFAELERKRIGERTKEALAALRRQGIGMGNHPKYGFKFKPDPTRLSTSGTPVRMLIPCPYTRWIGKHIVEWVEAGWSYDQIAKHLTGLGYRQKQDGTGGCFQSSTIYRRYWKERQLREREAKGETFVIPETMTGLASPPPQAPHTHYAICRKCGRRLTHTGKGDRLCPCGWRVLCYHLIAEEGQQRA